MTCDVIGSGSSGNAVILNNLIMVDCGLSSKKILPHSKDLFLVLLTHEHQDHFKPATVRALAKQRPTLRWGCCDWLSYQLVIAGVDPRQIDVYQPGATYRYEVNGIEVFVTAEVTFHDVPNCCYKIFIDKESCFYATDTGSLNNISAPAYDYYLVEGNYKQAEMEARIREKMESGEFSYESRVIQTHMSEEAAMDWIAKNIRPGGKYMFLHQHKEKGKEVENK